MALPLFVLTAFLLSGGWSEGVLHFQGLQASHWGWFALSAICSYGLGDAIFMWSSRSLGVPGALAIASCFPLWTVLAGYLLMGEKISIFQGLGILLTLAGMVMVILNGPKNPANSLAGGNPKIGVILALIASVAWATNAFANSRGGVGLLAPVANSIRMGFALLFSGVLSRFFTRETPLYIPFGQLRRWGWLFVLEAYGGSYFYIYGMTHSSLALGSILSSLSPVISVPFAVILGTERFSLYRTIGIALVVAGVGLLLGTF